MIRCKAGGGFDFLFSWLISVKFHCTTAKTSFEAFQDISTGVLFSLTPREFNRGCIIKPKIQGTVTSRGIRDQKEIRPVPLRVSAAERLNRKNTAPTFSWLDTPPHLFLFPRRGRDRPFRRVSSASRVCRAILVSCATRLHALCTRRPSSSSVRTRPYPSAFFSWSRPSVYCGGRVLRWSRGLRQFAALVG